MKTSTKVVGGIAGSAMALATSVTLIGGFEGKSNTAYKDIVGVWTVCYGETRNIQVGRIYSDGECDSMLAKGIVQFEQGLDTCMQPPNEMPIESKIAFVSWAYNVGIGAACNSTLVRKVNQGDYAGACRELPRWNRAGGRVIRGLTNRRIKERSLCLAGLK